MRVSSIIAQLAALGSTAPSQWTIMKPEKTEASMNRSPWAKLISSMMPYTSV